MTRMTIEVDGMTCDHCNHAVTEALSSLDGAREVDADFTTGTVVATFDAEPDERAIREAIAEEGYEVRAIHQA